MIKARIIKCSRKPKAIERLLLGLRHGNALDMRIGRDRRWENNARTVRPNSDGTRTFHHIGHELHRNPATRIAAHRNAMQAVIENLLHIRRIDNRDTCGDQRVIGLMRLRGRFCAVIVAGQCEHAAERRRSRGVGVFQCITAAIHAGALAVPDSEYAADTCAGKVGGLLCTPHRCRGKVLVNGGLKADVRFFE